MANIPDEGNPRMYPGDGEAGLADDNERSIAMLLIARATLARERDAMEGEYRAVRKIQDDEIAAIDAEVAKRRGQRARGSESIGPGEATG